MDVKLVVVEGRPLGAVVPVRVSPFVIGRDPGCQLRPKNPALSGRHSAIFLRDSQVVVGDLGSTNGTLVNDQCLHAGEEIQVFDGDRLQVGQLIFVVRIAAKALGMDSSLQEWLESPDAPETKSEADPNSRTLLLSALSHGGRPPNQNSGLETTSSATALKFRYQEFDQAHRVLCIGLSQAHLSDDSVGALRESLTSLVANPNYRRAVLDLAEVDSLPVATYTILLTLVERWRDAGGKLRLCSLSPTVKRMVVVLKLDRKIECYQDRFEAVSKSWD